MKRQLRARFWVEVGLATLTGFLTVLTLLWRDWFERVTGFAPDQHSGELEWIIVAFSFASTVVAGALARLEWRRAQAVRA